MMLESQDLQGRAEFIAKGCVQSLSSWPVTSCYGTFGSTTHETKSVVKVITSCFSGLQTVGCVAFCTRQSVKTPKGAIIMASIRESCLMCPDQILMIAAAMSGQQGQPCISPLVAVCHLALQVPLCQEKSWGC